MSTNPCTILLIEEEPILREVTSFRLELLGYEVACCEGANQANEWLELQLPRLVVIGQVAEADSIEFLNQLSNDPRTSEVPVIFLSGSSDLEEVQKAYNAGADEFLVTPYDPRVLENKVQDLISLAQTVKAKGQ